MKNVMLDMPENPSLSSAHSSDSNSSTSSTTPTTRLLNILYQTGNSKSSFLTSNYSSVFSRQAFINFLRQTILMRRNKFIKFSIYLLLSLTFLLLLWRPFAFHMSLASNGDGSDPNSETIIQELSRVDHGQSIHDNQNRVDIKPSNLQNRNEISQYLKKLDNSRQNDQTVISKSRLHERFDIIHRSHSDRNSVQTLNNFTYALRVNDFQLMNNKNAIQAKIREATKFSWDMYKRYAWGFDMLRPRSRQPEHWFKLGLTIVDSVDTLLMMGLIDEGNEALNWIENKLVLDSPNENSNCFELTIRILAGLLSAYHLTSREKIKYQAIDLGNRLLHCYDTPVKVIPYSDINLLTRNSHPPPWNQHSSLSEAASLQMEFRYLTQISGDKKFENTTFQTNEHIHNLLVNRKHKLLPMYIDTRSGQFEDSIITLGARTDSYYEYLLKQHIQTGIKWLGDDYLDTVDEIKDRLILTTNGPKNFTFLAELQIYKSVNGSEELKYINKMDHLVCFLPGTLALGWYHFSPNAHENRLKYNLETPKEQLNSRYNSHLMLAEQLSRTCNHMYSDMGTGLAPEIASFSVSSDPTSDKQPELFVQPGSTHNILRPEFVETLFYMYHITGLQKYRNQAERIFGSFQKYTRVASGYSPISDVRTDPPIGSNLNEKLFANAPDRMESFWLSETLKYLYLVFCDDQKIVATLLNNYVFNTEAHILPIIKEQ